MLKRLAAPGILVLLCIGLYWKLFTSQYTWLDHSDVANMEIPRLQFQAAEWQQGRFPLWDPHHWCGQPFLGQFTGAAYPLNWPFYLLPLHDGKIRQSSLHWYFVLVRIQGALFCYWLCRDLGRSRAASVVGGLVFAMSGFLSGAFWPQVFNGAIWAPAIFLFLLRAARGRAPLTSSILSGLCLGISWLSGHHEVPVYLSFAVAAAWLYFVVRPLRSRRLAIACAVMTVVIAILTSGLQTVPGYEFGKLARRWAGVVEPLSWGQPIPYNVHAHFSLTPSSALGIIFQGMYDHVNPFVGVVAASLAAFAIVMRWSRLPVRFFSAMALLSLLFSMASSNFIHGLLYSTVPVFGMARVPARLIVLFDFAAAPLAAFGFDALMARRSSIWLRRWMLGLIVLAAVVLGTAGIMRARRIDFDERFVFSGLIAALLAIVLFAWRRSAISPRFVAAPVLALLTLEFGNGLSHGLRNRAEMDESSPWRRLQETAGVAAFLRQQPQPLRLHYDDNAIPANIGDWHGIDALEGFTAGVTENIYRIGVHTERTQDLLGVGYTLARQPSRAGQVALFEGAAGVRVFQNPNAFPRAWVVHETRRVSRHDELYALLQQPGFDLRKTAPILEHPPRLETCEGRDQVDYVERNSNRIALRVDTSCTGMVVLADTWYPGWRAAVDGTPAVIHEVYGALRGVVVPTGEHRVEMTFRPWSVRIGAAMTALGFLAALVAGFNLRRSGAARYEY